MDDFDKRLLNHLQDDFPIVARPFAKIARDLDSTEEEVIAAVERLKSDGIIRRLGGVFSSRDLGFHSTLVAARVAPERLEETAAAVNEYAEVTHNYEREHTYNLWFTLTATSRDRAREITEELKSQMGVIDIQELPALEIYKVDVKFNM
ncbi:MAG: Lrp/AsnC family transcriptional regulator [Planctomycetes bacterium]|nr:Lrp/AsnC family transcriptional regulator [Planctomycetota bacterium]